MTACDIHPWRGLRAPCVWVLLYAAGCAEGPEEPLLDPDAIGSDQGTLVSIGDIRTVAQEMIRAMNQSSTLTALRAEGRPFRIRVGGFKQRTSIAIFDRKMFLNRFLSSLTAADAGGLYTFIAPVEPGWPDLSLPADLILDGELREILARDPTPDGGLLERRTVQYTLKLTRTRDDSIAWVKSHEIVKEQIQGAVYQ